MSQSTRVERRPRRVWPPAGGPTLRFGQRDVILHTGDPHVHIVHRRG
jgi:hypothetical protein